MTTVPQLLTINQVAKITKMTKEGVKYGVKTGKLKYTAMAGKSYLFTKEQVEEWRKAVHKIKVKAAAHASQASQPERIEKTLHLIRKAHQEHLSSYDDLLNVLNEHGNKLSALVTRMSSMESRIKDMMDKLTAPQAPAS